MRPAANPVERTLMSPVRAVFGLALLLALALIAPAAALAQADIQLSTRNLDFGRVAQHQVFPREIRIANRGDEELLISEVYTSCSCTEIALRDEVVPPGGSTVLEVTFHSRDLSGENDKVIEISSNDPDEPFIEIPVAAFVAAPIIVTPSDRVLEFGKVKRGEAERLEAAIVVEGRETLSLDLESLDETRFRAEILPGATPREATLAVSLREDAIAGPYRGILRLATDDPRMPTLDFELSCAVQGDLSTKPSRLNFRFVKPGQAIAREISISAATPGLVYRVTGAETDLPGLAVEVLDAGTDGAARLRVSGTAVSANDPLATANQGRVKGSLRVFTDLPGEPELRVDLLYMLR